MSSCGFDAVVSRQPCRRRVLPSSASPTVQLGAVAGGQDRRLRASGAWPRRAPAQALGVKHHLLADRERRGVVVQAEGEESHGKQGASGCFIAILPRPPAGRCAFPVV